MLTWEKIAADKNYGDIETQEDGDVYRGPLKAIRIDGGSVCFEAEWIAVLRLSDDRDAKWTLLNNPPPCRLSQKEVAPQDIGDGRIFFPMPALGGGTIFPKDGSRLDPRLVQGHPQYDPAFRPRG